MSIAYNPRFFTRADFPDDRTFEAAVILRVLNTCEVDERNLSHKVWRKTCPFILQNDSIASKYMTPDHGFMYVEAAADHFDLPCKIEPAIDDRILQIPEIILEEIAAHDLHLAMKVWKWYLQEFLHNSHIVTLTIKDCQDIYLVFCFFIEIKQKIIFVYKKPVSLALQYPIFWN